MFLRPLSEACIVPMTGVCSRRSNRRRGGITASLLTAESLLMAAMLAGAAAVLLSDAGTPAAASPEVGRSDYPVRGLAAVGPEGNLLATLFDDRCLLRDRAGGHRGVAWVRDGEPRVVAVAGSPVTGSLAMACSDGLLTVSDPQTGAVAFAQRLDLVARIITWSPDGGAIAVVSEDRQSVLVVSAETGKTQARFDHPKTDAAVFAGPDRLGIVAEGTLRVCTVETGRESARLSGLGQVLCLTHAEGVGFAAGLVSGVVRVWSPDDTGPPRNKRVDTVAVMSVAFLPDGRLATGGLGGEIRFWNPSDLSPAGRLRGHSRAVRDLVPTSLGLASGGHDGTVRVWDETTGVEQTRFGCL